MTIDIYHPFVNPKSDGVDATITRPSDWNANHPILMTPGVIGRTDEGLGLATVIPMEDLEGGTTTEGVFVRDFTGPYTYPTDATEDIQAAIDYAYANSIRCVYLDGEAYALSASLYLDPPSNMRVNFSNPPIGQFNMALIGEEGLSSAENNIGTRFWSSEEEAATLYVGSGQSMMVRNIQFSSGNNDYRVMKHPSHVALGLAGGNQGISRCIVENCFARGYHTGFQTGANGNINLCDSTTLIKCWAIDCAVGFHFAQIQNFINSMYDCQVANCHTGVLANAGTGVHIFGGNFSSFGVATKFYFDSVSNIVDTGVEAYPVSFDAVINNPDEGRNTYFTPFWLAGGVWDAFVLVTENYGKIPCILHAWNEGTSTATFRCRTDTPQVTVALTDIETDIAAMDGIYAAEMQKTFSGANMTIIGVHIENPTGCTTFFTSGAYFGANRPNTVCNAYVNHDSTFWYHSPADNPDAEDQFAAQFHIMSVWPMIEINNNDLRISDSVLGTGYSPAMIWFTSIGNYQLRIENVNNFTFNIEYLRTHTKWTDNGGNVASNYGSLFFGSGMFDRWYTSPQDVLNNTAGFSWQTTPFMGFRPSVWAYSTIDDVNFSRILERIGGATTYGPTSSSVYYPLLWGRQPYKIATAFPTTLVRGVHKEFTTIVSGRNGAGAITLTGATTGQLSACVDYVASIANLTDGSDARADFEYWISANNQIQQLSATDLSSKKFLVTIKSVLGFYSNHFGFTYGVDLTTSTTGLSGLSWHARGRSMCLYADPAHLTNMFPGLVVILKNSDDVDVKYMVWQVFKRDGYIKIGSYAPGDKAGDTYGFNAPATTTVTDDVFGQQPIDLVPM